MHIGLIGGIGPAATDFYYRGLIRLHAQAGRALELTIAHADMRELVENLTINAPGKQAEVFLPLLGQLAAAGAAVAAVTSMAGHFCLPELEPRSPLPLIDALPALDAAIAERGLRRVGLLGTRMVMETRLYGRVLAAAIVLPEDHQLDQVHRAYVEMATTGQVTEQQRDIFFSVGREQCRAHGAEAVILGGTDLFLAFNGEDCGFEVVDAARIHMAEIYRRSIGST